LARSSEIPKQDRQPTCSNITFLSTTMQHTERKHARLSASRAERFMTCPGSVRLESQMPDEPAGEAAAIGTAIHELSEKLLRGEAVNPNDYPDDHFNMAMEYVEFINKLVE
jgi:hypothetical protein